MNVALEPGFPANLFPSLFSNYSETQALNIRELEKWGEVMVFHRLDPLELELTRSCMPPDMDTGNGIKLRSSAKAAGAVDHWVITLAPKVSLFQKSK